MEQGVVQYSPTGNPGGRQEADSELLSPTAVAVWERIDGDSHVGEEVTISINRLMSEVKRTRPMVTKAIMQLCMQGHLRQLTPGSNRNQPHHYSVLRPMFHSTSPVTRSD